MRSASQRREKQGPLVTRNALVYTRTGCHLCEEAEQQLLAAGFQVEMVDIDQRPDLRDRYNLCVPVVLIDGKERFRGRINPHLLKRLVAREGD